MAKRPTRLRFTEDDLADSHVKKAADRADKAVWGTEKDAKANYKYSADKCPQRVGSR